MTRIFDPSIDWNDQGNPVSTGFDDVYYSKQNGLQETDLVFLQGNHLPDAWIGREQFTIAETGFGTGLNFLAAWKRFEETATGNERLDFISVEQFPLHKDDLSRSLQPWRAAIGDTFIDRLLAIYPPRFPGFHRRWVTDRVTLTLIFDEALRGFRQLACPVDAWFLDGFAPSKNPEMWQPQLYREMARLSHQDTTLGSFTAVGHIRRSLAEAGFTVRREKGFGYKYHRITGQYTAGQPRQTVIRPGHVTIIGAGIAGAACAHALKRRHIPVTLVEKNPELGMGASGNLLGLINPRIEAQDNPRNDAGLAAFSLANHLLSDLPDIGYAQRGALHVPSNDRKREKLDKLAAQSDWLAPHRQQRDEGIFFADAASVHTAQLVRRLLEGATIRFNETFRHDAQTPEPVILACGWGIREFLDTARIRLQPVRGQVTYAAIPHLDLSHPLMFGHYIAPYADGVFALGASFEKNNDKPEIKPEDDQANIDAARAHVPFDDCTIRDHWAQIRTASHDRFPITGKIPGHDSRYLSAALGSHGIQFGLLHGEILACLLTGAPLPLGQDAYQTLDIARFSRT